MSDDGQGDLFGRAVLRFAGEARRIVPSLRPGSEMRLILEFLLIHGCGHANAQPWPKIDKHLRDHGVTMEQKVFQQTILQDTRRNNIFIGSNDCGKGRGYFLIQKGEDVAVMRVWYRTRVERELRALSHLDKLAEGFE